MRKRTPARIPRTIRRIDLREDPGAILKRIRASRRPLLVTQNGKAAAIMLSVEAFKRVERERRILWSLARGEREIAAGKGYDLDDILEEVDRQLARD